MTGSPGIILSALDTAPVWKGSTATDSLLNTVELARRVERIGYHRFWIAEHHNLAGLATSAPAVLAGQIASATSTLRVGAGGVMLPNHPPLVVAEQFGTLAALHPGRVDLGLGRASGTDPHTAKALRRQAGLLGGNDFPSQVDELLRYFAPPAGAPADRARSAVVATPAAEHRVPVWILGSSGYSALLAASLGLPFAYAHHFSPFGTDAALDVYRSEFKPSAYLSEPYTLVSVFGLAAESDERAEELTGSLRMATALGSRGLNPVFPRPEEAAGFRYSHEELALVDRLFEPQLIGGPETARRRLEEFVKLTAADELMIVTAVPDIDERTRSYERFARFAGITAPDA